MPTASAGFGGSDDESGQSELVYYGPILSVQIGFDAAFQPVPGTRPSLPEHLHVALVDTGATASCIDSRLAELLRLPVVDQERIAGAQGVSTANVHLAHIYVPALRFTIQGTFSGVHLAAGGQPYQALLGRTFLQYFTMTYEGRTGAVTISND